jgi:hypothetical protein
MSYSLSKSTLLAGAFSLAFVGAALAHNPNWTPGGGGSCINTCKRANMEAVKSGQYKNLPSEDQSFTVCRANAANEGKRVGFNIVSSASEARCRVAHGSEGLWVTEYDCLCLGTIP